jgi:O-antigen/teichoic acid export membrane protein
MSGLRPCPSCTLVQAEGVSFRRNVVASYASQIYVTLISIAMMPVYRGLLGPEPYGLVGFFAMIQAWFMLLDLGLTPTLAREAARYRGGALSAHDFSCLLRALEWFFLGVAGMGAVLLWVAAGPIASSWLRVMELPVAEVRGALQVMALIVALRWMSGLYRSLVSGSEALVWLGVFTSGFATLRFVGVLLALHLIAATVQVFFTYQLIVAILELFVLWRHAASLAPPRVLARDTWREVWRVARPLLKLSLSIALTASIWIVVTQIDKLVLSRVLTLADYGDFSLAVLVAGAVSVLSGPVSSAVMPRMARLEAELDRAGLETVYRRSTQLVVAIASAGSVTLVFSAELLMRSWSGDAVLAERAAPILALYSIGNGLLAVSAFPYYLQYARGTMRMHLLGNLFFLVLLLPAMVFAALNFGGVGAGWAWLGINLLYLLVWIPLTHRHIWRGLHARWMLRDVLAIAFPVVVVAWGLDQVGEHHSARWLEFFSVGVKFVFTALAGLVCTSSGQQWLKKHAGKLG